MSADLEVGQLLGPRIWTGAQAPSMPSLHMPSLCLLVSGLSPMHWRHQLASSAEKGCVGGYSSNAPSTLEVAFPAECVDQYHWEKGVQVAVSTVVGAGRGRMYRQVGGKLWKGQEGK